MEKFIELLCQFVHANNLTRSAGGAIEENRFGGASVLASRGVISERRLAGTLAPPTSQIEFVSAFCRGAKTLEKLFCRAQS